MSKATSGASRCYGWRWDRTQPAPGRRATASRTARRAVSLLLAAFACASCGRFTPEREYNRAWGEFLRGDLEQAVAACTRNAGWRRPDSAWYWKFRLLQAEVLTTQSKDSDALKIVAQPLPARPELKELEARRLIDLASLRQG